MKALVQRVTGASVEAGGSVVGSIGRGMLVLLGVEKGDTPADLHYVAKKVSNLRIFEDTGGRMNLSVTDVGGEVLVVSQFTLAGDTRRGNRPSFERAEEPLEAQAMYRAFVDRLRSLGINVSTGEFAARMAVSLVNDGPVTIMVESKPKGG